MALINLRNALMAGKRLPYDAEVEYLEGTGTQYIDTGRQIPTDFWFDATIDITGTNNAYKTLLGARWATTVHDYQFSFQSSDNYFLARYGGGSAQYFSPLQTGMTRIRVESGGKLYINESFVSQLGVSSPSAFNIYIFALNTQGAVSQQAQYIRLYSLKYGGANEEHDLIPVRKGTVGYLYDRVTRKLFGNAGTGDFVVGPDVVPVEWLGNGASGSYILTNTHSGKDVSCNIKFAIVNPSLKPSTTQDCRLFPIRGQGVWNYNSYSMFFQCQSSNQPDYGRMSFHGHNNALSGVLATDSTFDINVSADGTDAVRITGTINGEPISSVSASISNITGNDYFRMLENVAVPDTGSCGLRLLGCSLIKGGQEINKYLPVRVGTEGAMMDTITRRIYRNAGTGAFGYGNDLKYPIPA